MKQNKGFFNKKSDISLSQDTTKPQFQTNLTPKTSHKKLRIFGAATLAVFMSATALFAFLPLTQTKISARPSNPTAEAVKLTPETDPTVFTTDDGLEIKSHNIVGENLESAQIQYFTLGNYNNSPLNWIVLASSAKMSDVTTPAGLAINEDSLKQKLTLSTTEELEPNQILVISEKVLDISYSFTSIQAREDSSQSLPSSNEDGSGWAYYWDAQYNSEYYSKLLVNEPSDFYNINPSLPNFSANINTLFTNSTLGLTEYLDKLIIKNSNFSSGYYGFALKSTHVDMLLPSFLRIGYNLNNESQPYWLNLDSMSDNIVIDITTTNYRDRYYHYHWYSTGTATCTHSASTNLYVTSAGELGATVAVSTGTVGYGGSYNSCRYVDGLWHYVHVPTCTYSTTYVFQTAYYRPAFVMQL